MSSPPSSSPPSVPTFPHGAQVASTVPTGNLLIWISAKCPNNVLAIQISGTYIYGDNHTSLGSTEMASGAELKFTTPLKTEYWFEHYQNVKFTVENASLDTGEAMIGEVEIAMAELTAATSPIGITVPNTSFELSVRVEPAPTKDQTLELTFSAKDLLKLDSGGKSDPYYILYAIQPDGSKTAVFRSVYIHQNIKPKWPTAWHNLSTLCNGDISRDILIEVWDYDSPTASDLIGSATVPVSQLVDGFTTNLTMDPETAKKMKKKESGGKLTVESSRVVPCVTMLDYIKSGRLQINLMFGIDFTASNGYPNVAGSLHETATGKNPYQKVIRAIGNILMPYDHDGRIIAAGFGASQPGNRSSSYFPLSPTSEEVEGIDGVLSAYAAALTVWKLSGPTNFELLVNRATERAKAAKTQAGVDGVLTYTVLTIITDGSIDDLKPTIKAIVEASKWPLSIIIIGVGEYHFRDMDRLDSDFTRLSWKPGKYEAERDVVQFVAFKKHEYNATRLAAEVLRELPDQIVEYMRINSIVPTLS